MVYAYRANSHANVDLMLYILHLTCNDIILFRLNYVIVRPGLVYGLGDKQGLSKL